VKFFLVFGATAKQAATRMWMSKDLETPTQERSGKIQ
jgi:hypothetical protein